MAFLPRLDARLVPKAAILGHVPTVRIYETEGQVPSYKRSTRLVMGKTTRCVVFRVLRCFLPFTPGIPTVLWIVSAQSVDPEADFLDTTSGAKKPEVKQSLYRSVKTLRHPKTEFFPQTAVFCKQSSPANSRFLLQTEFSRKQPFLAYRVFPSTEVFCEQSFSVNGGCSQTGVVQSLLV